MSHAIHLSDAAYATLARLAEQRQESPEAIIERMIATASPDDGPFYETEDWFRHLGASEERIQRARAVAANLNARSVATHARR